MEITATADINAQANAVWDIVKQFHRVDRWAPGVTHCEAEGSGVGTVRTLTTRDGNTFVERLETYDESVPSFSYTIVKGPIPVKNYSSRISVAEHGLKCQVSWATSGEPAGISDEQLEKILGSVCRGGVKALKSHCELQATAQFHKYVPEDE